MAELAVLSNLARQQATRYWGKYRAIVADNVDPERRGRCRLIVPSVLGTVETDWALPVLPYGGAADLGFLAVPPVDAMVVCEFIEGDISSPVWTGTLWRGADEVPSEVTNSAPTLKILKTESGHLLSFEDKQGAETITLKSKAEGIIELDFEGTVALTDSQGAVVRLDAKAGEIRIADANGNELVLSSSGITATDASGNEISTSASGIKVAGTTIEIKGQSVTVGGAGGEPLVKGTSFMSLFNTHTHATAVGPTSPPVAPMTPGVLTTATVAS